METNLTVIILTYNEEENITYALENVTKWAKKTYVLDSYSTDKTTQIAREYTPDIFYRKFDNYANQRNYALKELTFSTEWILFLDADEYLTPELKQEITEALKKNDTCDGYYLKRRFIFMGKWIRHGGYYPVKLLRLFKRSKGWVEREINEQFVVEGKVGELKYDFVDHNRKGISAWIEKHNRYSSMEADQLIKFSEKGDKEDSFGKLFGTMPQRKRWIRIHIWNKLLTPMTRPFVYFLYRYFFRMGFLDGKQGFIYFFLHSFNMVFLTGIKYIEKRDST